MSNNDHTENRQLDSNLLALAAVRAARWPHLFARIIERYLEINQVSEQELCVQLRCDQDTLNHLRLCARPAIDPSAFSLDVQRVAERFGLDAHLLAAIVREVDAVDAFQAFQPSLGVQQNTPFSSSSGGMLKAARDHELSTPGEATTEQEPEDKRET